MKKINHDKGCQGMHAILKKKIAKEDGRQEASQKMAKKDGYGRRPQNNDATA